MLVEFIIPTYNRINLLQCTLSSLIAQYDENWSATVIIDDIKNNSIVDMINQLDDDRIEYMYTGCRYNDWGHTPREIAKQLSTADYLVLTGDDNYYTPNFVTELRAASLTKPIIIYWDMVHSHYNYSYFECYPSINRIDMGAFATRRDVAQHIKLGTSYAADGEFIEDVKKLYSKDKMVKINKVLFVHN